MRYFKLLYLFTLDARLVVGEILRNITKREGVSKGKQLAYLNCFVKYLQKSKTQTTTGLKNDDGTAQRNLGFSVEEIFLWLVKNIIYPNPNRN